MVRWILRAVFAAAALLVTANLASAGDPTAFSLVTGDDGQLEWLRGLEPVLAFPRFAGERAIEPDSRSERIASANQGFGGDRA